MPLRKIQVHGFAWPLSGHMLRIALIAGALLQGLGAVGLQAAEAGSQLVEDYCAECHATRTEGESPFQPAPPLRDLHDRYDVELLEEALVEGLVTSHESMPEFEFDPDQARAIVEYLQSLQPIERSQDSVPTSNPTGSPAFGELTFKFYCTSCHGVGARGDAEVAAMLDPADLTTLAKRNGGEFPDNQVRRIIDGRSEIVGHTGVAMPPWGRLFAHELQSVKGDAKREAIISTRIGHLIAYLRAIQRE